MAAEGKWVRQLVSVQSFVRTVEICEFAECGTKNECASRIRALGTSSRNTKKNSGRGAVTTAMSAVFGSGDIVFVAKYKISPEVLFLAIKFPLPSYLSSTIMSKKVVGILGGSKSSSILTVHFLRSPRLLCNLRNNILNIYFAQVVASWVAC